MAATNELELLENVELRFALAESDAQLEKAVNTFLVPVILKLDSPAQNVRPKVMSILTHINKRIKSKSNISLPISPLLEVFSRSEGSALVKNFALIYIEMGFERINSTEQIPILKQLVHGFASRNEMQKTTLFHIIVQILMNMNVNQMDMKLPIMSQVEDYAQLLQRFVDLMLYHSMKDAPVPSMSKASIAFVTNNAKAKWSSSVEELRKAKISVLAFVSHCFPDNIPVEDSTTTMPLPDPLLLPRFLVLTAGSCDPNTQISDSAENGSRRIGRKPDFESEQFCQRLYKLYQGDSQVKQTQDADYRYPGSIQIKSKVLQLISRSIKAANMFPQMIQVVFDSLYGEQTTPKLRVAGMIFAQWIARMAAKETLTVVAPVIMVGLLKYLNEHFQEPGMDAENVRGSTYVCVGLVGKRAPQSLDLATLKLFFERLSTESSNVRISVQEALSNMLDAYHPSNRTYKDGEWESVLNLLETCALHTEHHCRFSALKFMNHLLPLSSPTRIYYNLLLSNDPKLEVREESKTGLSFSSHSDCTTLPSFSSVASLIISKPKNTNTQTRPGRHVPSLGLSSDVVYSAISYLRKLWICLADESVLLKLKSAEADGTGDIEDTLLDDPETREKVKKWMNTSWNELDAMEVDTDKSEEGDGVGRGLKLYLQIVEGSISLDVSDSSLQLVAATCLKELVSLGPSSFASRYTHKIEWLKAFLKEPSVKTATKQHVAHILGIVSTSLPDVILPLITDIFKLLSSQIPVDNHFGLVVALGYILGRTYYRYSQNHSKFIPTDVQEKILKHVIDDLDESDTLKQLGGIIALGEIGKYGQIPLALPSSSDVPTTPFESHILPKLQKITKASTKNSKLISSAISTTAYVTLSNPSPRNAILSYLYTLSTTFPKEIEIQFTVGESLCIIAAGWEATNARVHLDLADVSIETKKLEQDKIDGKEVMEEVIQFCFDELKGPKKMVRKAVCIWLLSLVKFAKSNEIIKKNLRNFHAAFSSLLGDRDEFTQEVASKGIGLVYDLGDQSIRDDLVSTLVQTLSEGKKVTEVTADTQLFENLGTTPDGSSLSTYQSILSLATEMNQPDLVYKFMSLASHNQLWNSRIGGAFGFSTILSKAEDELKPFLGTLIPKLFRYRFDPNERVQAAMGSIWKTLVKDPSKTVEEYFEPILKELMTGLMSRLWRVREASCLALSDLLSGKTLSQILATGQLVELWSNAFRALDDIKESVRAAALKTCRTFATLTIRFCDPTNVSIPEGTKIMNIVIPFLLHKGLLNDAEDVRKFSLKTILKICEKGGVLLQPHISEIVGILLECLASLEPQVMNYLSFHAEKYDVSQEQLENTAPFGVACLTAASHG